MLVMHNSEAVFIADDQILESSSEKVYLTPAEHYFDKYVNGSERKVLTAKAYDLLCARAGISVVHPESILNSSGVRVANPEITSERGMVSNVRIQIYAFGRNASGILSYVDLTLNYNLSSYFANDLFNKAVTETGWKDWAQLVPVGESADPKKRLRIPVTPGLDLACNIDTTEVIVAVREHQERCMFAERAALSMATRNAVSKLLGVKYAESDESGVYVPLTVWQRSDMKISDIVNACKNARDGKAIVDGQIVTGTQEVLEASIEDVRTEEDKPVEFEDKLLDTLKTENKKLEAEEPEAPKADPKDHPFVKSVVEAFEGEILPSEHEEEQLRIDIRNKLKTIKQWSKDPRVIDALKKVGARDANDLNSRKSYKERKKFLELISAA